jgi:hypothetical protein
LALLSLPEWTAAVQSPSDHPQRRAPPWRPVPAGRVRDAAGSFPDGGLDVALGTAGSLHPLDQDAQVVVGAVDARSHRWFSRLHRSSFSKLN